MNILSKMKYCLVTLFCLLGLSLQAQNVSVNEAQTYAMHFFSQFDTRSSRSGDLQLVWQGEQQKSRQAGTTPAYYVFNRGNNNGFVIISASKTTCPILAYSTEGEFSTQNIPSNLSSWLHTMANGITRSRQLPQSRTSRAQHEWNTILKAGNEIDLNTPNWDQTFPYNNKCPMVRGYRCYTGCAITATAIVMGYHQWPKNGIGTLPRYTAHENQLRIPALTLGEEYQWEKMPYINNNPEDYNDSQQVDAISTLMYHVGVMGQADFSIYGTSASLSTVSMGLISNMKYNPRLAYIARKGHSDEEWCQMLRDEIDAKRPIIYEGFDEESGHAFVIDGYNSSGYFNVNWGWGGRYNGFYLIDDMAPGMGGAGANGSGTYNLLQAGLFGVMPRTDIPQDASLEYVYNASFTPGLHVENLQLPAKKGDSFIPNVGLIRNISMTPLNGTCQLVMTDHKGNIIERFQSSPVSDLPPASTQLPLAYKSTETITHDVKPGYRLRIVFQPNGSNEWSPITCDASLGPWEILLMEGDPHEDQSIEMATSLGYDNTTRLVTITTIDGVTASLKHSSGEDCTAMLIVDGTIITFSAQTLKPGLYTLTLQKGNESKVLELKF